jgi:hypothetical protein
MQKVRMCEIKRGNKSGYPHIISQDEKNIFSCSHKQELSKVGDKVFYIHKHLKKAFFAKVTKDKIPAIHNFALNIWEFDVERKPYDAEEDHVLQKLQILESCALPDRWSSGKLTNTYSLWEPDISNPEERLEKIKDLKLIFRKGSSFELLDLCEKALRQRAAAIAAEEQILLGTDIKLYEAERPIQIQSVITFGDKYRQILMAIKTKPFVLLAGISGIGKSRLVRTLAYKTCIDKSLQQHEIPGNFELIKVRSDWHNSAPLTGYAVYESGVFRYIITAFLRFVVKAWRYPHVPFFVCFDEMNLARVEQYFAEFLSILETRRIYEERLYSDAYISGDNIRLYSTEDTRFWENLGMDKNDPLCRQFLMSGITLPPNLIVMGTVNMDETTHTFSRKVLDRAMTIEMNEVNMSKGLMIPADEMNEDDWQYPSVYFSPDLLSGTLHSANEAYQTDIERGRKIIRELEILNEILSDSPFKFAYRVRNEILIYCAYCLQLEPDPEHWDICLDICLDEMLMMKILSRIEGNEKKCEHIIKKLLKRISRRLPNSSKKLETMLEQLNNNGYTSYWN